MIEPAAWNEITQIADKLWTPTLALGGVLVGGYIANRSQRRHWLLDSKRVEYRELFSALTKSYSCIVNTTSFGIMTGAEELKIEEARLDGLNILRDRVVIGKQIRCMGLAEKWGEAAANFQKSQNYQAFAANSMKS